MPTYGYECKSCGYTFDAFQSMSDEPLKKCPKCGKKIHRLITGGTGIIFKGSGFYVNDNGSKTGSGEGGKKTAAAKTGGDSSPCAGCPASGGTAGAPACPKASGQ
ncbi:MAG: zinc ribbon domain-containing protein [Treponema sp.]|nr:zinc ribbon domain-containing protein [Treponema sp.]